MRASQELTGEPIGARTLERLKVGDTELAELQRAQLVDVVDSRYQARAMPEPERANPSDSPQEKALRQEAHRLGISVAELRVRKGLPPHPRGRPAQVPHVTTLSGSPVNPDSDSDQIRGNAVAPRDKVVTSSDCVTCASCGEPIAGIHDGTFREGQMVHRTCIPQANLGPISVAAGATA
jgi:hypothetical protein